MSVSALWGSVGVERNTPEDIWYAAGLLVSELLEKNALMGTDVVSVQFTATMDLDAAYPGEALRELGLTKIPVLSAQQMEIPGGEKQTLRVLIHVCGEARAPFLRLPRVSAPNQTLEGWE